MKVLQLTSHLNIGGITRYIICLSERLIAKGHRVIVASGTGSEETYVKAMGATHWRVPLHTSIEFSPQVFRGIQQLTARLAQEPVDVMHAHTRVGQVVADQVARRLGIPYVTTWHGIYKRRLGRRLWPCKGERTIAISELVHESLLNDFHVPAQRIRRIYNGIDGAHYAMPPADDVVQAYRSQWQLLAQRPVVGAIGRLAAGRVKGVDTLLVAVHLLQETFPELQVLIVGDGPRRPFLEDVAERLRVRHQTHFVGEVSDVRIPLALMDVFMFTSRWPEAFGLTLIEAMAAGKPVVATHAGAVPEIIQHGVNGWLVPSDDPSAMAEGVARLLNDPAFAKSLGRQATTRVRETFSLDQMAAEVEAVYQETVQRVASEERAYNKMM